MREWLAGKSVAIIGMARTGLAAAEVVKNLGARPVVFDRKPEHDLQDALHVLNVLGIEARAGSDEINLDGFDLLVPSPGVPKGMPVFADAQARGIDVISEVELAYRISRAPFISCTGTNGKTTTTVLIPLRPQAPPQHA